jgi:choline dehydrogenase-like flavoprotein
MIINSRTLAAGASLEYDLCIVGSGPAGITLALELADSKKRICILEAGDRKASKTDLQEFFSGDNVGLPYKLTDCRSRQFGGTSAQWAGYIAMLDPADFEENPGIPRIGWPISFTSLLPYYRRAFKQLGGGAFEFDPDRLSGPQHERIRFKADEVTSKIWHFNIVNFAEKYEKFLGRSQSIDVYLNAAVTRIHLDRGSGRVTSLTAATSAQATFAVKAKTFVLACGGMENARVLLAQRTGSGPAFANDNIGRHFMEHPHYFHCASLLLFGRHAESGLYHMPEADELVGKTALCAFFQIGAPMRKKLGWPNAVFRVQKAPAAIKLSKRVSMLLHGLYQGEEALERLTRIVIMAEQFPNPDSRISLTDKKDPYGMPKIRLNWQLTAAEIQKASQSTRFLGMKLGQNGLGRLQVEEWMATGNVTGHVNYGWHHMGTTRMALAAKDGVVDTDGKMFGLDNLYIAGSSIFPTSGCANPTFTLMATTIRLADHLKAKNA